MGRPDCPRLPARRLVSLENGSMTGPERLFSRPSTLTDDERERARAAFDESPSILDAAILAALGTCEHGERIAEAILGRVTCADS
jgi:hypothetical protein